MAALSASLLCSCSTTQAPRTTETIGAVRKVDFRQAPELHELAGHAREFGNDMYPKICALLLDQSTKPPKQFDLTVKPLKSRNRGEAHIEPKRIYLDSVCLTNSTNRLEQFDKVFVHEMTHMATLYRSWTASFWNSGLAAEHYWGESIADFTRFKLLGTNGWACPECNLQFPHYTSGYTCGGAFLLHLEASYGTNIVRQLIRALRQRTYTDKLFVDATGKSLEQLWAEFQQTDAFTPVALEANQLHRTLGYQDGLPPKDVRARFDKLVNEQGDDFARFAVRSTYQKGKPPRDVEKSAAVYLYVTQPGGSAEGFLYRLAKRNELPGKQKGEKVTMAVFRNYDELGSRSFPDLRTIDLRKPGDPGVYHYTVTRVSQGAEWKLERAWRTTKDGTTVEEFPVP